MGWEQTASGYAAVWAEENTREAIFDAMMRRETYATIGPRMIVRFFGGWDFEAQDANNRMPARVGYDKGVPMGGDLKNAPKGKSPTFLVAALFLLNRLDGTTMTAVVRPSKPYAQLRGERTWYITAGEYIGLGFHRILQGIDHLLFVLGLLLIVKRRMMLLKTISAFTVAHSITLAIATLRFASAPLPQLNAAIALSILFLGPEIVRFWRGEMSLTIRYPWVVSFLFGLLHGFGFVNIL
jgi:hypothetical protein